MSLKLKLKKNYERLFLILGDQLNANHSWFQQVDDTTLFLIVELPQETNYVKHHIQKLCAFFAAMEQFAQQLSSSGHHVLHLSLDQSSEYKDLPQLLRFLRKKYSIKEFAYQRPDEYRLLKQLEELELGSGVAIEEFDTEHFLLSFNELDQWVKPKQHNRMESFYRKMRRQFNVLMEDNQPLGGQWNYDSENRQRLKKDDLNTIPQPLLFTNDINDILERIKRHKIPHFGSIQSSLLWPINAQQADDLLKYFCQYCLPYFGTFQDAMTSQHEHQWSLFHSRLSFAINSKLLSPVMVMRQAISAYQVAKDRISIAQIEGFIRQILGWREFIRAIYWVNMPEYRDLNALNATRKLPDYFWNGQTNMNCLKHSIGQSLNYAYAHHIQRLMVIGNFCLLTGINPDQVDEWYLGVYIDAIEWVELPNTRGMSQFADNGIVATKAYAAGGNYINKMSDYCSNCVYKIKEKVSEKACPFNSLYWHFMIQHREQFEKNPRIGMIYRNWDKQSAENQEKTLDRAQWCLTNIEVL